LFFSFKRERGGKGRKGEGDHARSLGYPSRPPPLDPETARPVQAPKREGLIMRAESVTQFYCVLRTPERAVELGPIMSKPGDINEA